jgi:hypothetical protein
MSDELHDTIDDTGVKAAFEGYGADPGGEVRVDASAIAGAGRRRVRRNRVLAGAAGVAVVVGGIAIIPNLAGQSGAPAQIAAGGELPSTGRDANKLFGEAWGKTEGGVKTGGPGAELGRTLAGKLTSQPQFLDAAWQPGPDGKASVEWALLTWADGTKAAEGLLVANDDPIYIAVYPAPYTTCGTADTDGGRSCEVRQVKGKGWLKVVRTAPGKDAKVNVSLQRMDGDNTGRMYGFSVTGGAITKAALAGSRSPMGTLPVDVQAISDALLALP